MIASELIDSSIEKTKKLLLPFNFIVWIKLAVLVLFVSSSGGNFNSRVGNMDSGVIEYILTHWELILTLAIIGLLFGLAFMFLKSVFQFCFLDSVTKKKVMVFGYFSRNLEKGFSLFLLNLVVGIISLAVIGVIAYPFIKVFLLGNGNFSQLLNFLPLIIIGVLAILVMIAVGLLISIFTIYYMFINKKRAWYSFKKVFSLFRKEWKEMIVFLLLNFVLGILVGIIMFVIFLAVAFTAVLIAGFFFLMGFILYKIASVLLVFLIVMAVLLGIVLLIILIAALLMASVPFATFFAYYRLDFMKNLLGKK